MLLEQVLFYVNDKRKLNVAINVQNLQIVLWFNTQLLRLFVPKYHFQTHVGALLHAFGAFNSRSKLQKRESQA
jgi:hypothetical protein